MVGKATRNLIATIPKQNLKERRILEIRKRSILMHMTAKRTNLASNVVIEELSDVEDILCATFSYDASLNIHSLDVCISKNDLIDALLTVNDAMAQTWIVDSGASFHVTPIKECFSTFTAGSHGLTVNDALAHTWIVDFGASFHATPIKECFSTFTTQPWPCIPWKQSCMFQ